MGQNLITFTVIIIIFVTSCKESKSKSVNKFLTLKKGISTIYIRDTYKRVRKFKRIAIDIFVPNNNKVNGDLLVLPGWKFSRMRWHRETDLLLYAEKMGIRTIFPDMHISNYESEYFPETSLKWSLTPGGKWIKEIMIPYLQKKYGIFLKGNKNFLLGLSTGGRGVLLVSLQNPGLFTAGATLSGDCNQVKIPGDRLMTRQYGPYKKFKKRWADVDNPELRAIEGKWMMPLYIGHGKKDRVVPLSQSVTLYETLKKYYPELKVVYNFPKKAGHDFKYWNSEVRPVFNFFNEFLSAK